MRICLCCVYRYVFSVGNLCRDMDCIYGWRLGASVTQILPFCNDWRCHLGYRYFPMKAKCKLLMFLGFFF